MKFHPGQSVVIRGKVRQLVARANTHGDWALSREVDGSEYCNERDMKPDLAGRPMVPRGRR